MAAAVARGTVIDGDYEEVEYPGRWPTGAPVDHKVTTMTKITTKTWPPDSFFQQSEAERAERLRHQQERARQEEEVEALRREAIRRQEALEAFDRAQQARAHAPPPSRPPAYNDVLANRRESEEDVPKMTTKVVVRKWPPDSWFEEARKKAHARKPKPKPRPEPAEPRTLPPQSSQQLDQPYYPNSPGPYPVGQSQPVGQSPYYGSEHQPIPLDPTARMYNPHGHWPYTHGQPPKVRPPPQPMHRLREEMSMLMPETMGMYPPQQSPQPHQDHFPVHQGQYPTGQEGTPMRRDSMQQVHRGSMQIHQSMPLRQPSMQTPPVPYTQEQEELFELGDHFQCLGCGCHIKPSEVVYRPRIVPCLPPAVEHCPVPLRKPDGRAPVVLKPPPKPVPKPAPSPPRPPVQIPAMPPLQMPPEPEQLAIKDVEPFDFEKARQEGQERARKEEEEEYKIKTVENFDFDAARRAGQQAAQAPEPEPERVKIIEDFDFEAARRAGQQQAQQQQQPQQQPQSAQQSQGKIVEDFDFDAARRQPPAAAPPAAPKPSGFNFEAARAKVQAAAAARYVPNDEPEMMDGPPQPRKTMMAAVDAVIAANRLTTRKLVVKGPPNAPPRTIDATTDEEAAYCCLCMNEPKSAVILPCRHLCMCVGCSQRVQDCPVCRAGIQQRIEVFV